MKTRKMWEMTRLDIESAIKNGMGIILPVGSTEQHGYHLPVSTDTIIAVESAIAVAEEANMIVAPPVAYGCKSRPLSGGGEGFSGTISVKGTVFIHLLVDILEELIADGFKKIVLFNGHMENAAFIYEAAFEAYKNVQRPDTKILVFDMLVNGFSEQTMDAVFGDDFAGWGLEHASIYETSVMLHLKPELVNMDAAVDDCPEEVCWYDILPAPDKMLTKSGNLWKATKATKEKGELLWKEQVASLLSAVQKEFK